MRFRHAAPLIYLGALTTLQIGCAASDPANIGDVASLGSELSHFAGSWEGSAQGYTFEDGSDRVVVHLASDGSGTIAFGDSEPLAEPSLGAPYLPNWGSPTVGWTPGPFTPLAHYFYTHPYPGFAYTLSATFDSARLLLEVHPSDLMQPWCALFEPLTLTLDDATLHECVNHLNGFGALGDGQCYVGVPDSDEQLELPCEPLACRSICECDEASCDAVGQGATFLFDLSMSETGDQLVGTLSLSGTDTVVITLERQ